MGLGIKQGDTVVINVEGDNAEAVADNLPTSSSTPSDAPRITH